MWYVLWVMTGREENIINAIHNKVPDELYSKAWIPTRVKIAKFHGEEQQSLIRLFPGYVFVDTEVPEKIHMILKGEKNCIGFLRQEGEFSPVSEEEKKTISYFTDNKGIAGISLGKVIDGRTHIIDGPLKGLDDKIVRVDRHKKKAWVFLPNFLGKDREIPFALEMIETDV